MKVSIRSISKKTLLVAVTALLVGSGATVGVFAAIPDSNTGVIAGCRSTVTGALRAIDAQTGGTCGLLEAPISIASPSLVTDGESAVLRLKPDPQDSANYVMDTARSRNIVKADTFDDPNPENTDYRAICVEVEFTPEVSMTTVDQGLAGISPALQFSLLNQSSSIPEAIEYYCDSDDYNALMMLGPDMTFAVAQSVWFSK